MITERAKLRIVTRMKSVTSNLGGDLASLNLSLLARFLIHEFLFFMIFFCILLFYSADLLSQRRWLARRVDKLANGKDAQDSA